MPSTEQRPLTQRQRTKFARVVERITKAAVRGRYDDLWVGDIKDDGIFTDEVIMQQTELAMGDLIVRVTVTAVRAA